MVSGVVAQVASSYHHSSAVGLVVKRSFSSRLVPRAKIWEVAEELCRVKLPLLYYGKKKGWVLQELSETWEALG